MRYEDQPAITRRQFGISIASAAALAVGSTSAIAAELPTTLVAVLGLAHPHAAGFVQTIAKRANMKVAAVWDSQPALAEPLARQTGARIAKDPQSIWQDSSISAAVICAPTRLHEELVLAAAAAKKHLYVEKPLGVGGKDSLAMADAVEKAGVVFQTGYVFRSEAINLFLREQIKAGAFGTITRARCCNANGGLLNGQFDPGQPASWMMDPTLSGSGAFGDGGTHALDLLMWLLGDVSAVTATLGSATHNFKADEFGEALMRFKTGTVGSVAASWVDAANPVTLQITGTLGSAAVVRHQLFFKSSKVPGADGTKSWTELPANLSQPLDLFLDAVEGKKDQPLCTAREAAGRCAVMEVMYRAANQGQWIKIA